MKKEFVIENGKIVIELVRLFKNVFDNIFSEDLTLYGKITLYLPKNDELVVVYKTNTSYSVYDKKGITDINKLTDIWIDEFIEKNKVLISQIEKKATDLVKIKEHINLLSSDLVNTMLNELKADNSVSYYLKS